VSATRGTIQNLLHFQRGGPDVITEGVLGPLWGQGSQLAFLTFSLGYKNEINRAHGGTAQNRVCRVSGPRTTRAEKRGEISLVPEPKGRSNL